MKRLFAPLTIIATDLMKTILFTLTVASATYADTNSVDISTKYIAGDIVSTEGDLQIEVLENKKDRIEIGLFNQEDQMTALLEWDVKTETGNVILNYDTEDEQTLSIQISEHMNPENRMKILANGLFLMEEHSDESILSDEAELGLEPTTNSGVVTKRAISNVTTSGRMRPTRASTYPSHPFYRGLSFDNVTRKLIGRARLDLANDDPYQRHIWVRLLTRISDGKWKIMGWAHANKPNNGFSFVIPELYDLDNTSNDLNSTTLTSIQKLDGKKAYSYIFSRQYMADAWSGDGTRSNFAWVKLDVVLVLQELNINIPPF